MYVRLSAYRSSVQTRLDEARNHVGATPRAANRVRKSGSRSHRCLRLGEESSVEEIDRVRGGTLARLGRHRGFLARRADRRDVSALSD
jgi:hypothetical protein